MGNKGAYPRTAWGKTRLDMGVWAAYGIFMKKQLKEEETKLSSVGNSIENGNRKPQFCAKETAVTPRPSNPAPENREKLG